MLKKMFGNFIAIAFFVLFLPLKAHAANVQIICDGNSCTSYPDTGILNRMETLFDEHNWLPGYSVTKSIEVINNDDDEDCALQLSAVENTDIPANFSEKLNTVIRKDGSDIYGVSISVSQASSNKTLANLYSGDVISLGNIPQDGGSALFTWTVTFDTSAGNEFQNAETVFDFSVNFTCDFPGDDDDGDEDSDDDDGEDGDDDDTEDTLGTSTSIFARIPALPSPFGVLEEPEPEVEGLQDIIPEFSGEVKGETICISSLWWLLLLLLQSLIHFITHRRLTKDKKRKKFGYYLTHLLFGAVFAYVFWKYFCPIVDLYASLVITIVSLISAKIFKHKQNYGQS